MVQVAVPKFANEGNLYCINNIDKESRVKIMNNNNNCVYLKKGETQKRINEFHKELGEEPIYNS